MTVSLSFKITRSGVTVRTHHQLMNHLNRQAMEHVRDTFLPNHFKAAAFYEYPQVFRKRQARYLKWKQKRVGHTKPNVLSGKLRQHVLLNCKITATRDRARLRARAYFRMRPEHRRELEVVSAREKRRLATWMKRRYARLSQLPGFKAKRIRRSKHA